MQNETHYYLINGKVMKGGQMPDVMYNHPNYNDIMMTWKKTLQTCEIDESELEKIVLESHWNYNSKPKYITDIVFEKDGKIYFKEKERGINIILVDEPRVIVSMPQKQPTEKQVESECEAVELFKVDGELKLVHRYGQPEYIRDARGVLVSFPKITKYEGQEERYLQEINESFSLANIIINALKQPKKINGEIKAIEFAEWIYENRYVKYFGNDSMNCEKWYKQYTPPNREYYTTKQLYEIFKNR